MTSNTCETFLSAYFVCGNPSHGVTTMPAEEISTSATARPIILQAGLRGILVLMFTIISEPCVLQTPGDRGKLSQATVCCVISEKGGR